MKRNLFPAVLVALVALFLVGPAAHAYPVLADMSSPRAIEMADNILSWQTEVGGWDKNVDFSLAPRPPGQPRSTQMRNGVELATFDNGATIEEMRFIGMVYAATGIERFKESFERALDFILEAQYPTGGWPQVYPARGNYSDYVTFNDGAMINVMTMLREILSGGVYSFVDPSYFPRIEEALERGVDFILKAQIEVDGRLTAWCAQHDPYTYEPRPGRSYEHVSISGSESVGVVRFLMSWPDQTEEIRRAVLSALLWFEESQLPDGTWARFYEIGTNRPIFSGRDGIIKYDVMEIEAERRLGYSWFSTAASGLLAEARLNGTIEALFESLPEFPVPLIQFVNPKPGARAIVSGLLPLQVRVAAKESVDLHQVTISLNGKPIYVGAEAPAELLVETRALPDAAYELEAAAKYGAGQVVARTLPVTVRNWWRLEQEFQPPQDAGWFGTVDYLRASERSAGWAYATDRKESFFGDDTRLLRSGEGAEYLIYETPNLKSIELVAFAKSREELERGLEIALSDGGARWRVLPFDAAEAERGEAWQKFTISLDVSGVAGAHRARFTLREGVEPEAVQLGHLTLRGIEGNGE